jgi:hypothetical protein
MLISLVCLLMVRVFDWLALPALAGAGIETVPSGVQMPRMNAIMERWVQTCRHELLDRTLIWNQRHLLHAAGRPVRNDELGSVLVKRDHPDEGRRTGGEQRRRGCR